ncbi:F-box only protein 36 isoform X2 [Ursus maritimus]|uniref:F-box only protein n=1 Tax=Ursus maritimus TaxID=29073 RepID=A0A384C2F0_URSMA|nr:F-box only protein 36 isoform X2 [Ursus maritimus]
MTPIKPRPFLVVLATAVASQDGVVAAGDSVRNCRTRPSAEQRLLPVIGHPVPGVCYHLNLAPLLVTKWLQQLQQSHQSTMVIFRWWKISLRSEYRSTKPGEAKESHEEFLDNSHLQVQIALIFGARILDYVFNLCEGKFDFLERLSDKLLLNIISYLDLEDIARLSQTSRRFAQLCTSDKLWETIVQSACDTVTPDMRALAEDIGWRQMFFTNKLQLQRQLRKRRQRQGSQRNSTF